jgi:hypothetical protein
MFGNDSNKGLLPFSPESFVFSSVWERKKLEYTEQ